MRNIITNTMAAQPATNASPHTASLITESLITESLGGSLGDHLTHESGLATAEYAVATIAAVGFAGLLITILRSDSVRGALEGIITSALGSFG